MQRSIHRVPMACTSAPISVQQAAGNDAAQCHADIGVGTLPGIARGGNHHANEAKLEAR